MKVWTVVNQKGGVGKTTSTISIAGSLSAQGYKVLLLDLDPHASLTYYLGFDAENLTSSLYDVFCQTPSEPFDIKQALQATKIKNVGLLPSHIALSTLDKRFGTAPGKGLVIKKALEQLGSQFDIAIIDCPPVLGVLMVNGLVAANAIVVPTQTEYLALRGLDRMLQTLEQLKPTLQDEVLTLVVATLFDRRVNACLASYTKMRDNYKAHMWRGYIPVDTKFRDASQQGLPINMIVKDSRGAFAYDKLTNELLKYAA
ncbi:ParA family protein [Glaciecola siphonariae]|uniref:ParA family protein n=1 Tax=Glaciecola siphonariae TaxID=521012 RepID=A0ABV9LWR8_9ALTE